MRDTLQLLSGSSIARWRNAAAVWSSYHYARITGAPCIAGMPVSVAVEPTTSCNLRCPECPSGLRSFTRPTGMMDAALLDSVLQQLGPTLFWLTFYFQGEPYLHRELLTMVRKASAMGIYTATSTNGHYLDDDTARATVESGLDRLTVSIDGTSQDAYAAYRRGGILERVLEGTRNVVRWKKYFASATPHVVFQFLVVRQNEHQIPEVKRMARELGVDEVKLKTAQIYDYEKGSPLIPRNGRYTRYTRNADGSWRIKNGMANHCWKMWHSCVITWDGSVVPCCFDKDAHHVLGNIRDESFAEIWSGARYQAFRAALLESRRKIDMCRNCTEGTKVWA